MPNAKRLFLIAPLLLSLCANAAEPNAAATERENKEKFVQRIATNALQLNVLSEMSDKMQVVCKQYAAPGIAERNAATTKALYVALEKHYPGITERAATLRTLIPPKMGEVLRKGYARAIPSTDALEAQFKSDKSLADKICTSAGQSLQKGLDGFNQGGDFVGVSAADIKEMLALDVEKFGKEAPQYDPFAEMERQFEQLGKEAEAKAQAKKKAAAQ